MQNVNITQVAGAPTQNGLVVRNEDTIQVGVINGAAPFSGSNSLTLAVAGKLGVGGTIYAGTLAATIAYEESFDGGNTWSTAFVLVGGIQNLTGSVFTNPNTQTTITWMASNAVSHVRIRVSAYTSGSAVCNIRGSSQLSPVSIGAISAAIPGTQAPFFTIVTGGKAVTGAMTAVATGQACFPLYDVYGRLIIRQRDTWAVNQAPAVATQATCSQASAGAGVKNVCTSVSFTLSSTAAATVGSVIFNLRDGATGAGTILQTWRLSIVGVAGECNTFGLSGLWIEGTAATAMTLESSAAPGANTFATVSMTGSITQ